MRSLHHRMLRLFVASCFLTSIVSTAHAQTAVPAGNVMGLWTKAGSPYLVNGEVTVPQNQKLTIEPGVAVRFTGSYALTVNGALQAVGTAADSILFTVADPTGYETGTHVGWKGIRFQDVQHTDSSFLNFVVIEYGKRLGYGADLSGGALNCNTFGRLNLRNSALRKNQATLGGAIGLNNVKTILFRNLSIVRNKSTDGGGAIYSAGSTFEIRNCSINRNKDAYQGGGLYLSSNSIVKIERCVIVNNQGGALKAYWTSKVNINNSTIAGNTGAPDGFDLYLSDLTCKNSILWNKTQNNTYDEIEALDNSHVVLDHCIVKGALLAEWKATSCTTTDPKFIDLPKLNASLAWTNYPTKDATMSPAIDAGDAKAPHDPDGTIADIGAVPYLQTAAASPTVWFEADTTRQVAPASIKFKNYSTQAMGTISTWLWDFGDGATSSDKEPTHVYSNPGKYTVKLTATNGQSKSTTLQRTDYMTVIQGAVVKEGAVEGVWTKANSPYNISGNISILPGKTLTIEPGVEVIFFGHYQLKVSGSLKAQGTASDTIRFTRYDANYSWHSIRIDEVAADADSTIIQYCKIEYARYFNGDVTVNGGNGVFVKNFNKVRISHCLIQRNIGGRGGAVFLDHASVKITDNVLRYNSGNQYGGAIYVNASSPLITRNQVVSNSADVGGGIFMENTQGLLSYNVVSKNVSYWNGGGISLLSESNVTLLRNVISFNQSSNEDGGGLYISASSPVITNNTIAFDRAESGEGVLVGGYSKAVFTNTIIYANRDRYQDVNTGDEVTVETNNSAPDFYNCDIQGGIAGITSEYGTYSGVAKDNFDALPLFGNGAAGDFSLTWKNYPTVDNTKSPCIDVGKTDSHHDRDGSIADVGAYSFFQSNAKFAPRASFAVDTLQGFNELTVHFTDLSEKGTGNINKWLWTFGDGSTSGEQHATHTYASGTFEVSLQVTDDNGLSSAYTYPVTIKVDAGIFIEGGNVSGSWTGGQRYMVNGDIVVPFGQTLTVAPGTDIIFYGPYKVEVYGRLMAVGTAEAPIHFDVKDSTAFYNYEVYNRTIGAWAGIKFKGEYTAKDSSKLVYCVIQHAKSAEAGAIYTGVVDELIIDHCLINNNYAYGGGGAGIHCASSCLIQNNVISNNKTGMYGEGGGIYIGAGKPRILNNFIINNTASADGGAISCHWDPQPLISGNVIINNKGSRGGGIATFYASPTIVNNTILRNRVDNNQGGGGMFILYSYEDDISNNVIYDNEDFQVAVWDYDSKPKLEYNVIQNGINGVGYINNSYGSTNLASDPKLNPSANALGKILSSSPCINAGFPGDLSSKVAPVDILGNPRIADGRIDIGAYEYAPGKSPSVLANLGTIVVPQDFGSITINLDTVFAYYLGNQWLSFSIQPVAGGGIVSYQIEGNKLIITSVSGAFGEVTVNVVATDGENAPVTDKLTVRVERKVVVTGVEHPTFNEIAVYPNPAVDRVTLTQPARTTDTAVKIVTAGGVIVMECVIEPGNNHKDLDLSHLAPGEYILLLTPGHDVQYRKVIKQ